MKRILPVLCFLVSALSTRAQFIATVEMKEPVEGICNNTKVYALFKGFQGQIPPKCSLTNEEIQKLLNEVPFLKANPKFKGKGMAGVYINCKGEAIGWEIDNKSKSEELDKQLLEVFKTLTSWTQGKLNGMSVDARELISYTIKKGVLTLN
jgi:hypothetical protein